MKSGDGSRNSTFQKHHVHDQICKAQTGLAIIALKTTTTTNTKTITTITTTTSPNV